MSAGPTLRPARGVGAFQKRTSTRTLPAAFGTPWRMERWEPAVGGDSHPWIPPLPPPGGATHPFPLLCSLLPAGLPVRRSLQSPKPCQTSMGTRSGYEAGGSTPCLTHFRGDQHPRARPASLLGNAGLMTGRACCSSASQAAVPPLGQALLTVDQKAVKS